MIDQCIAQTKNPGSQSKPGANSFLKLPAAIS
jgi:hypothetical protein